jgi:protein-disulfide isomerase
VRASVTTGWVRWAGALGILVAVACSNGASGGGAAPATGEAPLGNPGQLAAQIGERKVTLAEIDKKMLDQNSEIAQQIYEARRSIIDAMIEEELLAGAAAKRSMTVEALLDEDVTKKIAPVDDAAVKAFFDENQGRLGGRTLEQISGQIKVFLEQQRATEARSTYIADLRKAAGVRVALDPPRRDVKVAADEPSRGPVEAPVTLVEYSDFQCPYCSRVGPTLAELKSAYGDKLRIVYRDYPLPFHGQAQSAAEAAQCAHAQGKFWEYHDRLFAEQDKIAEPAQLTTVAGAIGLDAAAFKTCLDGGQFRQAVTDEKTEGERLGVTATPTFFINGRLISGALPVDRFKEVIDEELERTGGAAGASE